MNFYRKIPLVVVIIITEGLFAVFEIMRDSMKSFLKENDWKPVVRTAIAGKYKFTEKSVNGLNRDIDKIVKFFLLVYLMFLYCD